ncbi:MAG: FISUMP domain-containing protein [Marinilabiliaceae bacterium]
MKNSIIPAAVFFVLLLASCGDDISAPDEFTTSQGTYIGVVHIAYSSVSADNAVNYVVERFDEDNAEWKDISWTEVTVWDDSGWDLPGNKLVPGKEYRYRMRAHSNGPGHSEYSVETTGYSFRADPSEITSVHRESDDHQDWITINWTNPNDLSEIKNLKGILYDIYRAASPDLGDFQIVRSLSYLDDGDNIEYDYSVVDYVDPDKTYAYKVETRYFYDYTDVSGEYQEHDEYFAERSSAGDEGGSGGDDNGGDEGDAEYGDGVSDAEGNEYKSVIIGEQEWMAENLKTNKFNDDTDIPYVDDDNDWVNLETPGYTWYENDENYSDPYGALYNWYTVETGKLCPDGWRVPTEDDWTELINHLGGVEQAGGKLKDTGTVDGGDGLWIDPNEGATNSTGFTGLPGGHRWEDSGFYDLANQGFWWSSDEGTNSLNAWHFRLHSHFPSVNKQEARKIDGLSVRCIKE